MKNKKQLFGFFSKVSAVCMMLVLLWLTISAPFVLSARQHIEKQQQITKAEMPDSDDENGNPFGNNTEEKAPSSTSFSEEFLHEHHEMDRLILIASQYHAPRNMGTYLAFHGELLVPPPNQA